MADQTAGNDPLGDRLRATFRAERADIERRRVAAGSVTRRSRSLIGIPLIAALVVVIATLMFLSTRSDDQASTTISPTPVPPPQPSAAPSLYPVEQAEGRICLGGDISLFKLDNAEPLWIGTGPRTAWATGSAFASREDFGTATFIEVNLIDDGRPVTGFIDPASVAFTKGPCIGTGDDNINNRPCTRVPGPTRTTSPEPTDAASTTAGEARSEADHIHSVRTQSNEECTRLVVEFGVNANEADRAAKVLPPLLVRHAPESIRITVTDRALESAFGDPDRVDYEGGIGLIALSFDYEFSVEFLHREMEPHLHFLHNPARVVIDLFQSESPDPVSPEPFGRNFVLRQPLQQDRMGKGIPAGSPLVVTGFGRPFEAQGLYRIWSVPADVDPGAFLAEPPTPLIEEVLLTSGWAEAWGSFSVELPYLEPGSYIAVFGELPPTDEHGFYGTGQLFRVAAAAGDASSALPNAQLLPDVQLPPEPFD